ncbi:FAD-dependent oxidoreductase [Paramyrothecium foliicola]|nr:FAD-dependent oxidoreductase [Paramyrothecium foliicola]
MKLLFATRSAALAMACAPASVSALAGRSSQDVLSSPSTTLNGIPYSTRAYWMRRANEALADVLDNPCPFAAFGTAIVNHTAGGLGELVCIGANSNRLTGNPTLHGEVAAITNCTAVLTDPEGQYGLDADQALAAFSELSLYTNAESCPMCASAIRWAGFKEYIYGTSIEKLIENGWGQIRISSMEVIRQSFDLGTTTRLLGEVLVNETDPYFLWQFNPESKFARMDKDSRVVVVGAGVFGLSTAFELSQDGYTNITVLDRHVPPVPDGSSSDISRIIRFDYGDPTYAELGKEAYDLWNSPTYREAFHKTPIVLTATNDAGRSYVKNCTASLDQQSLPWQSVKNGADVQEAFPIISGDIPSKDFVGYLNREAGWADASVAIAQLRDRCIETGAISFVSGAAGTVTGFDRSSDGKITAANTLSGNAIRGDFFVLATGAWSPKIVPMYNTVLSTGQTLGFIKLTDEEAKRYESLPIYINFTTGWFCFPPHPGTNYLKVAVHGWGYTRTENGAALETGTATSGISAPSPKPRSARANFAPDDAIQRLRHGIAEILPELASREFDRSAVCWYTDTPTSDFILDYHPDSPNLFLATGGSGHAFKFLPVLGKYAKAAMQKSLPQHLSQRWRFRQEYRTSKDVFKGDGSRGGPVRREFTAEEKARL